MRSSLFSLVLIAAVTACAGGQPDAQTEPFAHELAKVIVEPPPPGPEDQASPAPLLEPKAAFFAVYEALRDGDWAGFERFAGAPIQFEREQSIGGDGPEHSEIPGDSARAWLAQVRATWAPSCSERPDPPCRGLNLLSLGSDDDAQIELRCVEAQDPKGICCSHQPMLLHNTPFLTNVCFDALQRVTRVSVLDG